MEKRPDFETLVSYEEFKKYYWYRKELSGICRKLGIELQPGEISRPYIFKSESRYEFTTITLQAENVSDSPCSLLEAAIVKAVIDDAKEIYVDPVRIDLAFDERREWKDPYEMLGISSPETEEENAEGVPYKNIKILFTMNKYYKGVRRVTLTFNKHTG